MGRFVLYCNDCGRIERTQKLLQSHNVPLYFPLCYLRSHGQALECESTECSCYTLSDERVPSQGVRCNDANLNVPEMFADCALTSFQLVRGRTGSGIDLESYYSYQCDSIVAIECIFSWVTLIPEITFRHEAANARVLTRNIFLLEQKPI